MTQANEDQVVHVLDHGYVRLVEWVGSEMSIIRAARVSFNAVPRGGGEDEKLLSYLYRNKHTSPFEMVSFVFQVQAPIFIFRQWQRHRTWKYNEMSGRYTEMDHTFYVPMVGNIGVQSEKNKQAREINPTVTEKRVAERASYAEACHRAFEEYEFLLGAGWPRELARMVLPLSTYSRMFAKVDLHNLLHFLDLRMHPHAQWEIQQYAKAIVRLIQPIVPQTMKMFLEFREVQP